MPQPDDRVLRWFDQNSWFSLDIGFVELDGGTSWVVLARRGEEVIFAKAASQDEAWAKAFQMARPLDR